MAGTEGVGWEGDGLEEKNGYAHCLFLFKRLLEDD